jgi:hypothetical protein
MYQDVNNNSSLSTITEFDLGVPTGTGVDDDLLLSSYTASLTLSKGNMVWGTDIPAWSELYNDNVYSVIYNAATIGGSDFAVVVDAASFTLAGADPATYSQLAVNNNWVAAVPEPTTFMLLGFGGGLAWLVRKRQSFFM